MLLARQSRFRLRKALPQHREPYLHRCRTWQQGLDNMASLSVRRIVAEYQAGVADFAARTQARPFTQFWKVSTVDAPYRLAAAAGDAGRLAELLLQGIDPDYPDDGCMVPPLVYQWSA